MKILTAFAIFILFTNAISGQINREDSTVQVVNYWNNKDKQSYTISFEKYKVNDQKDTSDREKLSYDVDVTVLDSTANSYLVEWLYKNYKVNTTNKFTAKLMSVAENCRVIFKTDEFGAFIEVVNYKEVQDYIKKALKTLKLEFKDTPKIDEIVGHVEKMFSTRDAIQSLAIRDIHQFHIFHGVKYKLGEEFTNTIKQNNLLGGEPFDTEISVLLDEINFEDENAIFRMWQNINSEQLTEATYNYMVKMSANMGIPAPKRDDIKPLTNETRTASRIDGPSGWVIYSIETKETSTEGLVNIEERIIEIK